MRNWLTVILVVSICSYSFSEKTAAPLSRFNLAKTDTASKPPQFKDGGVIVKKLKDEFNCEAIEFENRGENDANDSTLTICLINSKKLSPENEEQTLSQIRAVASNIKNALRHPERYNAYHVIFVKREKALSATMNAHTAGATISAKEL